MQSESHKTLRREIVTYIVVGMAAVATDAGTYGFFLGLGLSFAKARALAFICGSLVSYALNKFITFKAKRLCWIEVLQFAVLYAATLFLSVCVNAGILRLMEAQSYRVEVAFALSTLVSIVLNYCGQKFWVFRDSSNTK